MGGVARCGKGRSSYARAMIELQVDLELKDIIMVAMTKLVGEGFYMCTFHVEYKWKPPWCSSYKLKIMMTWVQMGGLSKSAGKGPNSDMFPPGYGFLNMASSSTSTTPIVEIIDKIERQIIDGKLILVDDDGKPLPKVVSTTNIDSESEVEDVVDDHAVFITSTCLKCGVDSSYGTNSLLEQWRTTK
ncbi:hypothetical protein Tco_1242488 [Tanacetum coccineum]